MEELKVGDIVKYIKPKNEGEDDTKKIGQITKLSTDSYGRNIVWVIVTSHPRVEIGEEIYWFSDECVILESKSKTCNCNIQILMRKGCQCGKI